MKHTRLYVAAAALLAADQASKRLWRNADFDLLPGLLAFHGTRNSGMAFGLFSGRPALLGMIGLAVCIGRAGLALGGALGNLLDRLLHGYVIDFIDPVFLHWFVCNIADIGITCGAALLAIHLLFGKEEPHT